MQIVPITQRELDVFSPFDPEENIEGGIRYLRKLMDMFHKIELVVAAYNAGPGTVKKISRDSSLPRDTKICKKKS